MTNAEVMLSAKRNQVAWIQLEIRSVFEGSYVVNIQFQMRSASLASRVFPNKLIPNRLPTIRSIALGSDRVNAFDHLIFRLSWYWLETKHAEGKKKHNVDYNPADDDRSDVLYCKLPQVHSFNPVQHEKQAMQKAQPMQKANQRQIQWQT